MRSNIIRADTDGRRLFKAAGEERSFGFFFCRSTIAFLPDMN